MEGGCVEIHLTRMGYGTGCLLLKREKKSKEEERKGTLHPGRGTPAQKTVANSLYRGLTPFPPLPLPSPLACVRYGCTVGKFFSYNE